MNLLEQAEPARLGAEWESFTTSPNKAMAELVASKFGGAALMARQG